jgi:hypothetical protein
LIHGAIATLSVRPSVKRPSGLSAYGAVQTSAVENWPRVSSTRLGSVLQKVKAGKFSVEDVEHFMKIEDRRSSASDDETNE